VLPGSEALSSRLNPFGGPRRLWADPLYGGGISSKVTGEDVLLTLGEVAIAVAGFSSIVAVFGRRSEREWSGVESFRLSALILNAAGPALLAFLPFALLNLRVSPPVVWGVSSAILLVFIVAETAWVFMRAPAAFRETQETILIWRAIIANSCAGLAAILQICNIAGLWFHQELGPYLAGLLLLLAIAVLQFCFLILSPRSSEPPAT